ncbi:MAG TPA: hypothetical protein VGJ13_11365 [Pseudonocardiaceae bacterium]
MSPPPASRQVVTSGWPATRQIVAAGLALLTLLTAGLVAADVTSPVRLYLTVAFVVLAPGWALAAYLRTDQQALIWSAAVSMGIALTILIAQVMVSAGFWHPEGGLLALAGLTLVALLHHMVRPPESDPAPPGPAAPAAEPR